MESSITTNASLLFGEKENEFCPPDTSYIKDKNVLVTGAGGSIGAALCKKLAMLSPKKLILADICENGIFELCNELSQNGFSHFSPEIVSITDKCAMQRLFEKYRPSVIFHAAAHKHVPLMELCPAEAVKNNVFGTKNVAELAVQYGAEKFLLISTDKAVSPVNIMGATKRICEYLMWESSRHQSKTQMITVRFGNVLGSNGSVIPLFEKQIAKHRTVTVTHPECTRYFISVSKAVSLVISAGDMAKSGDIFTADMGNPINVAELAKKLIIFRGLVPEKDVKIVYIGLRPGEKLHERLSDEDEIFTTSDVSGIDVCSCGFSCSERLAAEAEKISLSLEKLDNSCKEFNNSQAKRILKEIFPSLSN